MACPTIRRGVPRSEGWRSPCLPCGPSGQELRHGCPRACGAIAEAPAAATLTNLFRPVHITVGRARATTAERRTRSSTPIARETMAARRAYPSPSLRIQQQRRAPTPCAMLPRRDRMWQAIDLSPRRQTRLPERQGPARPRSHASGTTQAAMPVSHHSPHHYRRLSRRLRSQRPRGVSRRLPSRRPGSRSRHGDPTGSVGPPTEHETLRASTNRS